MRKVAGQPRTTPIEKIKTQYWFHFVKSLIREEMLEECDKNLTELVLLNKKGKDVRREFRAAKNKFQRLKKKGPMLSEIASHLEKMELNSGIDSFAPENGIGLFSSKVWGRYASGMYTPSRILDELVLFYPTSKHAYQNGPNNLFAILEANTLSDACLLILDAFTSMLGKPQQFPECEQIDFLISTDEDSEDSITWIVNRLIYDLATMTPFEPIYSYFNKISEMFLSLRAEMTVEGKACWQQLSFLRSFRDLQMKDAACMYLCIKYVEAKFLGYPSNPFQLRTLGIFETIAQFGIDADIWVKHDPEADSCPLSILIDMEHSELNSTFIRQINYRLDNLRADRPLKLSLSLDDKWD